jgi:superfamily II DNA or RNA helicase
MLAIIKQLLNQFALKCDVLVLKGFPVSTIQELSKEYKLLDEQVYDNGKINLNNINSSILLSSIMTLSSERKGILCYESFIEMTSTFRNLSILNKRFYVVNNNFLSIYPNPTNQDLPDYDSPEFMNNSSANEKYVAYYSLCKHIDGKQFIQYNEAALDESDNYSLVDLLSPVDVHIEKSNPRRELPKLASDDDSIDDALLEIYEKGKLSYNSFQIEERDKADSRLGALCHIAKILRIPLKIYVDHFKIEEEERQELKKLLKKIWGYKEFRKLKVYKAPDTNREAIEISQGSIIETVIHEAEKAHNGERYSNVLLTAPTGAGKSILFQMAAIYLAEKYGLLTIIIQPIVALMNDQVDSLSKLYPGAATINGTKTPEEKEAVLKKIRDRKVNLLFLAPELLLSYSLDKFLGNRNLGLVVVDEAHTVTTWGRDFRVDYWFLGDYLRQQRRYLNYKFPIFALTATAVYDPSGDNDMVFDTIRSLNMNPCLKYIGVVRRENVVFDIENIKIDQTKYDQERRELTSKRIIEFIEGKQKAIVYFPYKSTVNQMLHFVSSLTPYLPQIGEYQSSMSPGDKKLNAEEFREGKRLIMCATKAFGMGIDVPDINIIYHHAVTGNLVDYIQEIGRVARDQSLTGYAKIDFTGEKDYKYIRILHGLSAIKSFQLFGVLSKLLEIYRMNGEKRNLLISPQDFAYLFKGKDDDINQKVKSCLLLISNDLQNKLHFPALIVRAKNIFSKIYISVAEDKEKEFKIKYCRYIHELEGHSGTYLLYADDLWNKKYSNLTFPSFKTQLMYHDILGEYQLRFLNKIDISIPNDRPLSEVKNKLDDFFKKSEDILNMLYVDHRRISSDDIRKLFLNKLPSLEQEQFMNAFKMIYCADQDTAYCKTYYSGENETESFQINDSGYDVVRPKYLKSFKKHIISQTVSVVCAQKSSLIKIAELLNALGLVSYQRQGGEDLQIFVRINATNKISDIVRSGHYDNDILNSIYQKYQYSERVFTHFFTTKMTNEERWDFIEDYFLGEPESKLLGNKEQ